MNGDKNNINNKLIKNKNLAKIRNNSKNIKQYNSNKNFSKNKVNNDNNNNNIIPKQKYNIDLFLGLKEQFENEKADKNNNKNIYLDFYNKHTKNQVLQKENETSKKFLENNKQYIKQKQEKFKLKKAEEEKIRKQKEKEDTNEYRKLQMAKLYKVEDIYKKEIAKRKNNKYLSQKKKEKISITAKNKNNKDIKINVDKKQEEKKQINKKEKKDTNNINITNSDNNNKIKITREEYNKKLDSLIKQRRIYLNELEKLPIANKTNKVYERELQLNKYIDEMQEQIKKYQIHDGIEIIEK